MTRKRRPMSEGNVARPMEPADPADRKCLMGEIVEMV